MCFSRLRLKIFAKKRISIGKDLVFYTPVAQDETGCFYRALPEKSLAEKKKQCHGGKKAKQRLTISFLVNAAGEKEVPVVIGKAGLREFDGFCYFKWTASENHNGVIQDQKLHQPHINSRQLMILIMLFYKKKHL